MSSSAPLFVDQIEFRQVGALVRRSAWLIVLLAVLGAALGGAAGLTQPRRFEAAALLAINSTAAPAAAKNSSAPRSSVAPDRRILQTACLDYSVVDEIYRRYAQALTPNAPDAAASVTWPHGKPQLRVEMAGGRLFRLKVVADDAKAAQTLADIWSQIVIETIGVKFGVASQLDTLTTQVKQAEQTWADAVAATQQTSAAHGLALLQRRLNQQQESLSDLIRSSERLAIVSDEAQVLRQAIGAADNDKAVSAGQFLSLQRLERAVLDLGSIDRRGEQGSPTALHLLSGKPEALRRLDTVLESATSRSVTLDRRRSAAQQGIEQTQQQLTAAQIARDLVYEKQVVARQNLQMLSRWLNELTTLDSLRREIVQVFSPAELPNKPINSKPTFTATMSGLAGALLGIIISLFRGGRKP